MNTALNIDGILYLYFNGEKSYYYKENKSVSMSGVNSLNAVIANLSSERVDINGSIATIEIGMNMLIANYRNMSANALSNEMKVRMSVLINNILYYSEKARLDLLSYPANIKNAIHHLKNAIYINSQLINMLSGGVVDAGVC